MKNESTLRQGVEGVMMKGVGENQPDKVSENDGNERQSDMYYGKNQLRNELRLLIPSMVDEILGLVNKDIQTILTEKLLIKCECEDANCPNCKRLYDVMETIASLAGEDKGDKI